MSTWNLTEESAKAFAGEWIAAWNAHDVERVLAHWADDCVFTSPFVTRVTGDPTGTVNGKAALRAYWTRAITAFPGLHFELTHVFVGQRSLVLGYRNHRGQSCAEMIELD